MISIIIPFYNHADLVHSRLMEIYKYAPSDCEIILINDASTDTDCDGIVAFWQKNVARNVIRYKKNQENIGFGMSMNKGAEMARGAVLIFYSNDVVMSGDAVSQIYTAIKGNPEILLGGRIVYWPAGWNEFEHEGKKFVIPYCEGWLLACTRTVWDNLGGFDPIYGKYDYEDVDLSATALWNSYDLVGLNSPFLNHLGAQTISYGDERMNHTKENRELFIQKWAIKFEELFKRLEGQQHA